MSTITCSPNYAPTGLANIPVVVLGVGTSWLTTAPSITASGPSGTTATISGGRAISNTEFGVMTLVTTGCSAGTVTLTDSVSGDTCTIALQACATMPVTNGAIVGTTGNELSTLALANGGGWAIQGAFGVGQYLSLATVQTSAAGTGETLVYVPTADVAQYIALDGGPLGHDQVVTLDVATLTPTDNTIVGVIGACDPLANTCILGRYRYQSGSPAVQIYAFVKGTATALALSGTSGTLVGTVPTMTASTKYTFKLTIGYASQSLAILDHTGAQVCKLTTSGVTLGTTTGTAWQPGYTGFYVNTATAVGATTTTGWRVGNLQATGSPRCAMVNVQSGTNWPTIPAITATANYLMVTNENFVGGYNDNEGASDIWLWRVPISSPFSIPTRQILLNGGTGASSLINNYTGNPAVVQDQALTWLPGVGSGAHGRLMLIWTQMGSSSTIIYYEQRCYPGINNATSTSMWTSYSDDEGVTWASPTDITPQVKASDWSIIGCGPGNCLTQLQNGSLFATFWYNKVDTGTYEITVANGATSFFFTGTGAQTPAGSFLAFTAAEDSSKTVYFQGPGITDLSPAFAGTGGSALQAVCTSFLPNAQIQSACMSTTDLTGATGWTVGGSPGLGVAGFQPNEVQHAQLGNGSIIAAQRCVGQTVQQFAISHDNGATWALATPASFPLPTPVCTVGFINYFGALLYSGPNSASTRIANTLTYSRDNGVTWSATTAPSGNVPGGTLINDGGAMYSAMAIMPNGDVALHHLVGIAGGTNPALSIIPAQWLTGASTGIMYSVTGTSNGTPLVASSNFTVTPNLAATDTINLSDGGNGGTFTPTSLSWTASAAAKTFTYTPATEGHKNLTLTSTGGNTVFSSPWPYNATISLKLTGPSSGLEGSPSANFTVTPSAATVDSITFSDGGAGGTFSPNPLALSGAGAVNFTYTPGSAGTITLTLTSGDGATISGSPFTYTSYGVQVDSYVDKPGKLIYFSANSLVTQLNDNWLQATITTVNTNPTVKVNGNVVQLGPPVPVPACNFVAYLLQCGGVQAINMVNAGATSYTTPTCVWNNDGGGSGLTTGTPVLAKGLLTYSITSGGSGYTKSFATQIPAIAGQSPSVPATVWVTVAAGVVTSVVPLTGSSLSYGVGFTGTSATGIVLPGSGALTYSNDAGYFKWWASGVPGTGLTVSAVIGNYIQTIPVTNPGTGFTSPPTFTIADSTGTLASCVPVMTGCASTDVVTCSAAAGWLTTSILGVGGYSVPAMTNAAVANSVGQLEGPVGHCQGFTATPTMAAGANTGAAPITVFRSNYFTGKNKLKCADPWQPGFGSTGAAITLDSNFFPVSWTPHGWIKTLFYGYSGAQASTTTSAPQGLWTAAYDDDFYGGVCSATAPAYVDLSAAGSNGASIAIVAGPSTTLPTAGSVTLVSQKVTNIAFTAGSGLQAVKISITGGGGTGAAAVGTVAGGALTSITIVCGGSGYTGAPSVTITPVAMVGGVVTLVYNATLFPLNAGNNLLLTLEMVADTDGLCHAHNAWVFAPNNTIDRSKPFATDDVVVANLTRNGMGPGVLRFMDVVGGPLYQQLVDESDILNPDNFSWLMNYNWGGNPIPSPAPPNCPTFSGTTTTGQATITGITSTAGLVVGQPIVGAGIPGILFGVTDNHYDLATILSIDSTSQITISTNAKLTGVQSLSVNPTPSGTVIFGFARPYSTDPANPHGYAWGSSPHIYSSENWTNASDAFGPYLDLSGGLSGVPDNGRFITYNGGSANLSQGLVELRSVLPHGLKSGQTTATGFPFFVPNQTFTGNTSNTVASITNVAGGHLFAGQLVIGAGIPSGTTITVVSGTTLTLSHAATANGTGVSFTVVQALPWTHAGVYPIASTTFNQGYTSGYLWVTGPNTIVVQSGVGGSGGSGTDTISGTVEIPIYLPLQMIASNQQEPYEYCAAMVANWSNTALHLCLPDACSDALVVSAAQRTAANIGPTNPIILELKDEHWNNGNVGEIIYEQQMAYLLRFYPSGTSLYPHYTPSGATAFFTTAGINTALTYDQIHCLRAANRHYVFTNAFAAAGGNPDNVKLMYGSQYGASNVTTNLVGAIKLFNLPQHFIATAPYMGTAQSAPFGLACHPAGYANGAGGNWPVDAMNSLTRHYLFYSRTLQAEYSSHSSQFADDDAAVDCLRGRSELHHARGAPIRRPDPAGRVLSRVIQRSGLLLPCGTAKR